jgi:hypothetical protein
MYEWGSVGRKNELSSVLQRLDFGLPDMTPEGVAAARSSTQPVGEQQQRIIEMLESRMRQVFKHGTLWRDSEVNMIQLSQIPAGQCLGHHHDRRDKWQEGIASVAWSSAAGDNDDRGQLLATPPTPAPYNITSASSQLCFSSASELLST